MLLYQRVTNDIIHIVSYTHISSQFGGLHRQGRRTWRRRSPSASRAWQFGWEDQMGCGFAWNIYTCLCYIYIHDIQYIINTTIYNIYIYIIIIYIYIYIYIYNIYIYIYNNIYIYIMYIYNNNIHIYVYIYIYYTCWIVILDKINTIWRCQKTPSKLHIFTIPYSIYSRMTIYIYVYIMYTHVYMSPQKRWKREIFLKKW